MYHNGEWNPVYYYGSDLNDVQVVCKELGFGNAIAVIYDAYYGEGRGSVLYHVLQCHGTEWSIRNCSRSYSVRSDRHVGVKCHSGIICLGY